MTPRVVALVARQRGLITYRQALELSLSSDTVARLRRSGAWVRVRRGVYADAEVWAGLDDYVGRPLLRVRAEQLVLEVPHVFSHDSAALVHGMSLLRPVGGLVHLTRLDVRDDRTKAGIKHHGAAYSPDQVQVVDGLPCLDPARTAVDVAREHGLGVGVGACDHVLRAGGSRTDLREPAPSCRRARGPCAPGRTSASSARRSSSLTAAPTTRRSRRPGSWSPSSVSVGRRHSSGSPTAAGRSGATCGSAGTSSSSTAG